MGVRFTGGDGADATFSPARPIAAISGSPAPSVRGVAAASDAVVLALTVVAVVWRREPSAALVVAYAALAFLSLDVIAPPRGRIGASCMDEAGWIAQRLALPLLVLVPVAGGRVADLADPLAATIVGVYAMRAMSYALLRLARSRRIASTPCVIVGAGELGVRLAIVLRKHRVYGLEPVGFLDDTARPDLPLPVLGGPADLDRTITEHGVRTVFVADGEASDAALTDALRACNRHLELYLVPRLPDVGTIPGYTERIWGVPVLHVDRAILRRSSRALKRSFDVVVASAALLVLWPLMLAAAVATKVTSGGRVLFRQERVGRAGRIFQIYKFRTMEEFDDSDTTWSVSGDHRMTRVGSLLRRTSIDELPQLFNVLRGEMSIVGPRPERPFFAEWFSSTTPGFDDRHRVLGGMTGLAQIHGCRGGPVQAIPERARFDNAYIDHWSFWGDIVIICRTVRMLLHGNEPTIALPEAVPSSGDADGPIDPTLPGGVTL